MMMLGWLPRGDLRIRHGDLLFVEHSGSAGPSFDREPKNRGAPFSFPLRQPDAEMRHGKRDDGRRGRRKEADTFILWVLIWSELAAFGILIAAFLVASLIAADDFAVARLHLNRL